ncbi:MAG: hypothetical protein V4507_08960 [Verrucomicrobiota bacterium]
MISKGYIGLFKKPIDRAILNQVIECWLSRFERVEQLVPGDANGTSALSIKKPEELMWHPNMEFRVTQGEEFTWVYVGAGSRVMETSGFPSEQISMSVDVFIELPGIIEIIDDIDEQRLNELEKEGIL